MQTQGTSIQHLIETTEINAYTCTGTVTDLQRKCCTVNWQKHVQADRFHSQPVREREITLLYENSI